MKRFVTRVAALAVFGACPFHRPLANDDIVLRGMGSFHIGGRIAEVNGQGGAHDRAPARRAASPSSIRTASTWSSRCMCSTSCRRTEGQAAAADVAWRRPHRRDLREHAGRPRGLAQLSSCARAGTSTSPTRSSAAAPALRRRTSGRREPTFLTYQDPFERFRIGDGEGSWNADPAKRKVLPGSQFPVEAYDNYMRQSVPRWLSTDKAIIDGLYRAGRQSLPLRGAGAQPGRRLRLQGRRAAARQGQGIVAVESATAGIVANAPKLKNMPVLMMFGDYVDQHPRWAAFKKIDIDYGNAIKAAGGTVDWINLPEIGIKGNSPHVMQDKNNAADRRGHPEMAGRQRAWSN